MYFGGARYQSQSLGPVRSPREWEETPAEFHQAQCPLNFTDDSGGWMVYRFEMSFTEVLAKLPLLTVAERQLVVRRALDLDEPGLSEKDEVLLEKRLEDHLQNPDSAVPLEEMKTRLRSRFAK